MPNVVFRAAFPAHTCAGPFLKFLGEKCTPSIFVCMFFSTGRSCDVGLICGRNIGFGCLSSVIIFGHSLDLWIPYLYLGNTKASHDHTKMLPPIASSIIPSEPKSEEAFLLGALICLPFGRKRVNCDHHMPSLWRSSSLRVQQGGLVAR